MHIAKVVIENFGPYRGRHALELGPMAYGVTARFEDDSEKSNTGGKTSLLEAIRFALHGIHREVLEDDWLTNGEKEGGVELVFNDGRTVLRSRVRGKSTKLWFEGATQAEAQNRIDEVLGFTCEDSSTWHVAQTQAASFIKGDPAARTAMVASWMRLDRLEACEANVRKRLANLALVHAKVEQRLDTAKALVERALGDAKDEEALDAENDALCERLEVARKAHEAMGDHKARKVEVERLRAAKGRYEAIVQEGMELAGKLKELRGDGSLDERTARLELEAKQTYAAMVAGDEEVRAKSRLAKGEFDGVCPVAGIECPAKAQIQGMGREHAAALKHAVHQYGVLQGDYKLAQGALETAQAVQRRIEAIESRLISFREEAKRLQADARAYDELAVEADDFEPRAGDEYEVLFARMTSLQVRRADLRRGVEEYQVAMDELRQIDDYAATHREALAIFGRQGAQKRVAEESLREIEDEANALLSGAGIDLECALEWQREGKGPAGECVACGWAFPSSTRVKACEKCGVPRGPKIITALEVVRSKVSGAADDLTGIAISLAAASWLRAERGAQWQVAMLDEPLSQADKANRRAIGAHLVSMLRGAGIVQAFFVSHDEASMAALPGKIAVVSDGEHARLEVA
jgi:DNA repair exonuclease SbcCD ATPase subunit